MIAEAPFLLDEGSETGTLDTVMSGYVNQWLKMCHQFMAWHRKHILESEPTEQDHINEERILPWLIRGARTLHAQMLDPNWPHPELAGDVEISLWQLEQAWVQTHNPMSEAQADLILAEVFQKK